MEGRNTQSQYTDTGPTSTDFFEWSLTVLQRHREHPNKRYRQTCRCRRMDIHDTRKAEDIRSSCPAKIPLHMLSWFLSQSFPSLRLCKVQPPLEPMALSVIGKATTRTWCHLGSCVVGQNPQHPESRGDNKVWPGQDLPQEPHWHPFQPISCTCTCFPLPSRRIQPNDRTLPWPIEPSAIMREASEER